MADPNNPNPTDPKDGGDGSGDSKELHKVLGRELGKEFPTEEAALKAVKDTFQYVGKAGKMEAAIKAVMTSKGLNEDQAIDLIKNLPASEPQNMNASDFVSKAEFQEATFFSDNPDLKPYKEIIQTFKKANPGKSLDEIVREPSFKQWMDSDLEARRKQKSILHTNPKIQVAEDKLSKGKEALSKGDVEGAKANAVGAVMDAFGMKESES